MSEGDAELAHRTSNAAIELFSQQMPTTALEEPFIAKDQDPVCVPPTTHPTNYNETTNVIKIVKK